MVIWMDGCGLTYNSLASNYDYIGGTVDNTGAPRAIVDTGTNGRWGGRGWFQQSVNGGADFGYFGKFLTSGAADTWGVSLSFKWGNGSFQSSTPTTSPIFQLKETTTYHMTLGFQGNGDLIVKRGDFNGGTTLSTVTAAMTINTWYHLEMWTKCHDSTGTVEVRLNGTTVINLTGTDTRNGGTSGLFNCIEFGPTFGWSSQPNWRINDLVVMNNTGSFNNTFIGDRRIMLLTPTGAGTYSEWTKAGSSPAATNYQGIDEVPHNSDTDRNDSLTVGQRDSFVMSDLGSTATQVNAMRYYITAKKSDVGPRTLGGFARIGGADYVSSGVNIPTTTYTPISIIHESSPATGVAFTGSEINNAEFGYKLTS